MNPGTFIMSSVRINHPQRLFPADPGIRSIASELYQTVCDLPIVSPHGHTDPVWFAQDDSFPNAFDLLVKPDHYLIRMLYSQGIPLESLGIDPLEGRQTDTSSRDAWRIFAQNFHLFTGTPSQLWLNQVFDEVFDLQVPGNLMRLIKGADVGTLVKAD
jgi:glucuronate isomerase